MIDRIPIKTNPKMFDLAVSKIQNVLGSITWFDHVFGICEFLTDVKDGKKFTSANVYVGKNRYEQIMPCEALGNFAMFVMRDPQTISKQGNRNITSPFSLIIWYNMNNVSLPLDERNREQIKYHIYKALEGAHFPWLVLNKIYEKPENVFEGFSYEHTDNQFLMSPYAGMRIDGEITIVVPC